MNNQEPFSQQVSEPSLPEQLDDIADSGLFGGSFTFGEQVTPGLKLVVDVDLNYKVAYLGKTKQWNDKNELWYSFNNKRVTFLR